MAFVVHHPGVVLGFGNSLLCQRQPSPVRRGVITLFVGIYSGLEVRQQAHGAEQGQYQNQPFHSARAIRDTHFLIDPVGPTA